MHYIPVVYSFYNGIVFDVVSLHDGQRVENFLRLYQSVDESDPNVIEQIEYERFYGGLHFADVQVNGGGQLRSSSAQFYLPQEGQEEQDRLAWIDAYPQLLNSGSCFSISRHLVRCGRKDAQGPEILTLLLGEKRAFLPLGRSITLSCDESRRKIQITHPVSGKRHTLWMKTGERLEFGLGAPGHIPLPKRLSKYHEILYGVEPPLEPDEEIRLRVENEDMCPSNAAFSQAASVGIIGGADGPTAIFIAQPEEKGMRAGEKRIFSHLSDAWKQELRITVRGIEVTQIPQTEFVLKKGEGSA